MRARVLLSGQTLSAAQLLFGNFFLRRPFATFAKMDDIPEVDIDSEGKFKYILIKVEEKDSSKAKHIVRGYSWAPFHADILERVEPHILKSKLKCECVGGGRIEHLPAKKTIRIYGYSQGYGQADHKISCELVKKEYPEYSVTWSNDGY